MNDNSTTRDPRDDLPPVQDVQAPMNAMAEQTLAVDLARAEIDQLIATAHRFPRRLDVVAQQIEQLACRNEAAAENSVYALPRAGKAIVGPSIGFANIVAGAWGNCWDYGRWIHTDRREKVVVAEGIFVDWQTNRRLAISEQRRICNSRGQLYSDDMIVVTSKAATSIARRNVILNAVPRAIWFPVYEKALYIVRGSEAELTTRREAAVKALANFGVNPKQVMMYLGVSRLEEIGIENMPTLRGMFVQLRDGAVTVEEMFDPRRMTGTAFEQVDNPLGDEAETAELGAKPPGPQQGASAPAAAAGAAQPATATTQQATQAAAQATTADKPKRVRDRSKATLAAKAAAKGGQPEPQPAAQADQAMQAEPPKAAAAPQPPTQAKGPTNSAEYLDHAMAYIGAATSAEALKNAWKSERDLRTSCSVVEDAFAKLHAAYMAKVAALEGGK